jgi:hypothetical protein
VDEHVLGKKSGHEALFVCGADPGRSSLAVDGDRAERFPTPEAALSYRGRMPGPGPARACAVFRILPGGGLLPPGTGVTAPAVRTPAPCPLIIGRAGPKGSLTTP